MMRSQWWVGGYLVAQWQNDCLGMATDEQDGESACSELQMVLQNAHLDIARNSSQVIDHVAVV